MPKQFAGVSAVRRFERAMALAIIVAVTQVTAGAAETNKPAKREVEAAPDEQHDHAAEINP